MMPVSLRRPGILHGLLHDPESRYTTAALVCPKCGLPSLEHDTSHPSIEVRLICEPCDWRVILTWRSRGGAFRE